MEGNSSSFLVDDYFFEAGSSEGETEPEIAVLFPFFVEVLGLLVFFILSRWISVLPYTAVMFVLGVVMGIGAARTGFDDELTESIKIWAAINSEVLLLVFLPGLIFKDALHINFHLFTASLSQILLLAFPMVLAGTVLTACVAFYIFPYGWSWNLAMTFGSILSATDPVAVAALLGEVGAPPRLTMHITGESMFNDGSAMVFFDIFAGLFLHELNIEGLGDEITLAEGFKSFFRLSLGGFCIGVAFSMGLILILYCLDRRLDNENNVVQVAATVTTAYLTFYVSEVTAGCSGIIAVVICGITTSAFGGGFINDNQMMEDFWGLLEHLLNTLLFTLGGGVWGSIIGNTDERERFAGRDWGYLILLYILVMAIRFVCVGTFYPIISHIGLKTNWQESVFLCFGGLRGAVGIALAISLDNDVRSATEDEDQRALTNKLFGMVGGVALCTLLINGSTAGPILIKLGLAKPTETHRKLSQHFVRLLKKMLLEEYGALVNDPRFEACNFGKVKAHMTFLEDVTDKEVELATQHAKERELHRLKVLSDISETWGKSSTLHPPRLEETQAFGEKELRFLFLELLRGVYEKATAEGFLDARVDNGYVHYLLLQSLEFAGDIVNRGGPITGWEFTELKQLSSSKSFTDSIYRLVFSRSGTAEGREAYKKEHHQKRINILKAFVFQEAHRTARKILQAEFADDADETLTKASKTILKESKNQEFHATAFLKSTDKAEMESFVSHYVCTILLNKATKSVETHTKSGLLRDQEAHEFLELIDEAIRNIHFCTMAHATSIE